MTFDDYENGERDIKLVPWPRPHRRLVGLLALNEEEVQLAEARAAAHLRDEQNLSVDVHVGTFHAELALQMLALALVPPDAQSNEAKIAASVQRVRKLLPAQRVYLVAQYETHVAEIEASWAEPVKEAAVG